MKNIVVGNYVDSPMGTGQVVKIADELVTVQYTPSLSIVFAVDRVTVIPKPNRLTWEGLA